MNTYKNIFPCGWCKNMGNKTIIWVIMSAIGFGLFTITYALAWHGEPSYPLFWFSLGITSLAMFQLIRTSTNISRVVIILFVLGAIIYSMQIYRGVNFFYGRDEMDHYQGYNGIAGTGFLDPERTARPQFNSYPGFEIDVAMMKEVTGLSSLASGKIYTGLIHSLMLVFLALYFYKISSSVMPSGVAGFIYGISPRYELFSAIVSYETAGLFLLTVLLLLLYLKMRNSSVPVVIASLIVMMSLVITHHASAYMFLLYLIIVTIVARIQKRGVNAQFSRNISGFAMLTAALSFGWLFYNSVITFGYVTQSIIGRMINIVFAGSFSGSGIQAMASSAKQWDPIYEIIARRFLYVPDLLVLSAIGAYLILKGGVLSNKYEAKALVIWGPLLFVLSIPFVISNSSGSEWGYRVWDFVLIGVAFVAAVGITELAKKRSLVINGAITCSLLILFVGGISLARPNVLRFPLKEPVTLTSYYTLDIFKAAGWMDQYAGYKLNVAGTMADWDVFGGYGGERVDYKKSANIFRSRSMDKVISMVKGFTYIVADNRLTEMSYPGDLFSYYNRHIDGKLPISSLDKFAGFNGLDCLYDNGNIILYKT